MSERIIPFLTLHQISQFWAKVEISSPDSCWNWIGHITHRGYGGFNIHPVGCFQAHRVAWTMANGQVPDGLSILHRCDNRKCCNPAHLFAGTNHDNTQDMMRKGRHACSVIMGEGHPNAKLNEFQVRAVREQFAKGGVTVTELARQWHMSRSQIARIVSGSGRTANGRYRITTPPLVTTWPV